VTRPRPDGYHDVTPYLIVRGAAAAITFYERAFGATERMRLPMPGGKLGHAEVQVGDSVVMLADEMPEAGWKAPSSYGGTTVSLLVYVPDVDSAFDRAVGAGATVVRPLENQFYGDRTGTLTDPFGHMWTLATHVEDVSPEEMAARCSKMTGDCAPA
jgi:PhnB protein